jgi:competence protein ComEA
MPPEEIIQKLKLPIIFILLAFLFLGISVFVIKGNFLNTSPKVEVLSISTSAPTTSPEIIVEIAGAIQKPGVYHMPPNSRIEDLIIAAGGISREADRLWLDKSLNKAAKLTDGQKIYIKQSGETSATVSISGMNVAQYNNSTESGLVNINTASISDLDTLPGIGQTYGQKIIDNRPYSNPQELVSKKVIPQTTYDKIKNLISVN